MAQSVKQAKKGQALVQRLAFNSMLGLTRMVNQIRPRNTCLDRITN
jgi:hypothetical protein